jgi:ABC-type multidrug transport system fused ATPase/permease subunit
MINSNEEYEKHVGETEAYMVEILNNIDKIIYRGQTENEIGMFSEKTEKSINSAMNFYSNINNHSLFMTILVFIILFISLWYLIRLFFKQGIDLTTFITFFTMLLLYRDKMLIIIQQVPDFLEFLGRSDAVLKHFRNMEGEYQTILDKKVTSNEKINCHRIRFDNVSFKYETNDKYLFRNFNIDLETNDKIIGITGLSGNGKSTFAKLLLKMYKPTEGAIYIDGQDIKDMDANYIRKNITYVNQNSKLFDKKIVENILYGCSDLDACNGHLNEIMQYKKIKELYKNLDIYNKQSGSLGENLSGGQRQVINIIGGLVNPSKIIILDEPTNALDIDLKQEILDLIRNFKKYKNAIIIITHDKDVYPLFNEKIQI